MLRNQRQPSHPSKQQPQQQQQQQQQSQTQQRMQPDDILERTLHDYLACHPTYMIPLIRAHHFIFRDVGPLSMSLRHYIAIMAASRHRCSFLVTLSRKEFIASRGNPDWLKGLAFVPEKIRSLNEINKILSHQPWMLKPEHFESLTKPNMWTLSELTHAITIMAHVHSLCTLSFGCKFGFAKPENFDEEDADYEEVEIEEVRMSENGTQTIKKIVRRSPASKLIIERCKQLERENANFSQIFNFSLKQKDKRRSKSKQSTTQSPIVVDTPPAHCDSPVGHSDENIITPGVVVASDAAGSDVEKQDAQPSESKSELDAAQFKENTWSADLWRKCNYNVFIEDADFSYVDFAKRGRPSDVSTFRFQDYQWDDQGYSLSNTLYPDVASFLDEKFKVGYNLTYYTLGPKTNIDTSPFRRAIWNYIQCIYGMRHDDYNYREVNILLERNLKGFIKVLGCYPEMVVKHDFSGVMQGFRASEKIHVIIMVTEARLQVEYLYALRALMEFMKMCS